MIECSRSKMMKDMSDSIRSFERFCGENDVFIDEVDSDLMVRYENFLKAAGVCPNTTLFLME